MLFNNPINCYDYTVLMIDKWIRSTGGMILTREN